MLTLKVKSFDKVMFDMNGTLFDDTHEFCRTINTMLAHYDLETKRNEEIREQFSKSLRKFFREAGLSEEAAKDEELECLYNRLHSDGVARAGIFKDAASVLKVLHFSGVKLAIISAQAEELNTMILKRSGLEKYFFKVMSRVDDKAAAIKQLVAESGFEPMRCAYIGDQASDVHAALEAGVFAIAFLGGLHTAEKLFSAKPHVIVSSYGEFYKMFFDCPEHFEYASPY